MRLILLTLVGIALSGCSFFQENPELAATGIHITVAEVIYRADDSCEKAEDFLEGVEEARGVLDDGILSLLDLESDIRQKLIEKTGLSPATSSLLIEVGRAYVQNKQEIIRTTLLTEETEIAIRELLDVIEGVAQDSLVNCE